MYATGFVLLMVIGYPREIAVPPAPPLVGLRVPPAPPIPMINPLFTNTKVSPDVPPDKVRPGVPVLVEYK
jgi:hypothetical protein